MVPHLVLGVGLFIFLLAAAGWLAAVVTLVLAEAVLALLVGFVWAWEALRHPGDDAGWRLSAATLWLLGEGQRRYGRLHVGPAGVRWEPGSKAKSQSTPFAVGWAGINSFQSFRKAPFTTGLQITTTSGVVYNLSVQAGPRKVERAMQARDTGL